MSSILVAGGSGLVGTKLIQMLQTHHDDVAILSRDANSNALFWNPSKGEIDPIALEGVNVLVNLAGTNVAEKRWTKSQRLNIMSSRIDSTNLLFKAVKQLQKKPKVYIAASATGFYGTNTSDNSFKELDRKGEGFLADVCERWELGAKQFESIGVRTVIIRTGVVLSPRGGFLNKTLPLVKNYLGAGLGSGKQNIPWIHIEDLCNIFIECLTNESYQGIYNAVAPEKVSNNEMMKNMAKVIGSRIILPNIPAIALKLMLGEMSSMLINGSPVSCKKITDSGFKFKFNTVNSALENLLKK